MMKVRGARGWECQKGGQAETYLYNREGVPTREGEMLPTAGYPPTFSRSSSSLLTVTSQAVLPSSSGSIGLLRRQQH